MPTAARLFASIAFTVLGYLATGIYRSGLPSETPTGALLPVCAAIGFLCGWIVMGKRVGKGYYAAAGTGVRTAATMVFFALLGFSVYEMVLRSMRKRYDGVFSAIEGTFDIILIYGAPLLRPDPVIALVVGGVLGGMLAEWAGRQWR